MEAAFIEGRKPGHCDPHGYAAEILAVRDWLFPEEPEPPSHPPTAEEATLRTLQWAIYNRHQRLRELLTSQADEAKSAASDA